jgi:predicted small secreted protein
MRRKGILLVALLAVLALVSAACGSDTGNESGAGDEQRNQSTDAQDDVEGTDSDDTEAEEDAEPADATYVATEFAFEGPDSLPAGDVTLTMDNQGKQMHELALGELLQGKTMDDVHALLRKGQPKKPPKWFRTVSGTGAAPGETGTFDAELTPGAYIMICFVPDEAKKKPHAMLGMMKEVTVE